MQKMKMRTCLWFDGTAREAAEFYAKVFPDSRVESGGFKSPGADGKPESDLTVEFTVLGHAYLGLNGGPHIKPNEAVSFLVYTDDQAETDRYWNAIVDNGGKVSDCGWCKDRWGFSWQITPRALMEGMADPDRVVAKRVMDAMMTMQKIDVAKIEAARAGRA